MCKQTVSPIDLVYDAELEDYDLSRFSNDLQLIEHVRKGISEATLMKNIDGIVRLDDTFGTIQPDNFYQNLNTGENNILSARAA